MMKKLLLLLLFIPLVSFGQDYFEQDKDVIEKWNESRTWEKAKELQELDQDFLDYKFKDGDLVRVRVNDTAIEKGWHPYYFVYKIRKLGDTTYSQFVQDSTIVPRVYLPKYRFNFGYYFKYDRDLIGPIGNYIFGLPYTEYDSKENKLFKTKFYVGKHSINYADLNSKKLRHASRSEFTQKADKLNIVVQPFYIRTSSSQPGFSNEFIFASQGLNYKYKSFPLETDSGRIHSKLPLGLYFPFSKNDFDFNNNYDLQVDLEGPLSTLSSYNYTQNQIRIMIGDIKNESYLDLFLRYDFQSKSPYDDYGLKMDAKLLFKGIEMFNDSFELMSDLTWYRENGKTIYVQKMKVDSPWDRKFPEKIKVLKQSDHFIIAIDGKAMFKIPSVDFEKFEVEAFQENSGISFYSTFAHILKDRYEDGEIKDATTLNNKIREHKNDNNLLNISKITINQTVKNNIASESYSSEWKGNGSGFFISKSGYLATNYHVVEDASEIEIEYINNQKNYIYKADIIQTDPSNDLAILKITDPTFQSLPSIPYNIKTRSSDVGSSVFALGYPMALSGMGKEIKFTDGKISSKTGFNGDIRTYQTTTPIQGGNSGGPLFDYKGNLVGINSAKISSSKADNVSYSIKSSYLNNLMDVLPQSVSIPSDTSLSTKSLTDQIKVLSNYVVLIKVK
jgi:S1-C subfamily serine protease